MRRRNEGVATAMRALRLAEQQRNTQLFGKAVEGLAAAGGVGQLDRKAYAAVKQRLIASLRRAK